jgi:hypothetical protein
MTFYNLPETDVTIEYHKDDKLLIVSNLPEGYSLAEGIDTETDDKRINQVLVAWGPDPIGMAQ